MERVSRHSPLVLERFSFRTSLSGRAMHSASERGNGSGSVQTQGRREAPVRVGQHGRWRVVFLASAYSIS